MTKSTKIPTWLWILLGFVGLHYVRHWAHRRSRTASLDGPAPGHMSRPQLVAARIISRRQLRTGTRVATTEAFDEGRIYGQNAEYLPGSSGGRVLSGEELNLL